MEPPTVGPDHPYTGRNLGRPYDLAATRLRYFGGTSNHWGGWCSAPLTPRDFTVRDHIPLSDWPLSRRVWFRTSINALEVCEVATAGLGLAAFEHDFGYEGFLHHAVPELQVKNFLFSPPTRFGTRYWEDLRTRGACGVLPGRELVRLMTAEGDVNGALILSS